VGGPKDYTIGNGFRFGFRFDLNTGDHIGYELNYAYSRSSLMDNLAGQSSSSGFGIHTVTGNALWHFVKRDSRVRPFVMGGLGFSNFVPPGSSAASGGGSNEFLLNYGGGVKVKIGSKWGKDFGLRADIHQYQYFSKPFGQYFYNATGKLQQTEATAGIGILF
jgi:hypothetical protein